MSRTVTITPAAAVASISPRAASPGSISLPRLRGGPVGPRERRFSARRAFETFGLGWGPAPCLDLGEDGVSQLLRSRHRAEHFGAIPPGGLQLDVPEAPGSAPQPLERGQVLDPIDGDRSGKLRNDSLV